MLAFPADTVASQSVGLIALALLVLDWQLTRTPAVKNTLGRYVRCIFGRNGHAVSSTGLC